MKLIVLFAITASVASFALADEPSTAIHRVDEASKAAGIEAAKRDIAKGVIRYGIVGEPMRSDVEIKNQAFSQYGINVEFSGCRVSQTADYDGGYREEVVRHLKKKYGFDPVARIQETLMNKK